MSNSAQHAQHPATPPFYVNVMTGAVAGMAGTCVIFPLDIIKTRLQKDAGGKLYNGAIDCLRKTYSNGGFRALYRGLAVNLIGVGPEKALKLSMNDLFRKKLQGDDEKLSIPKGMLAGAGAGLCQVICTNPMEVAKIQFQLDALKVSAAAAEGRTIAPLRIDSMMGQLSPPGWKGLYKGTAATLMRDIPFSMVYFPLYSYFKEAMADSDGLTSAPKVFCASTAAGAFAAFLSTPADVVKTQLQAPGSSYRTIAEAAQGVLQERGTAAFFTGATQRCMIIAPLFGVALVFYEVQKRLYVWYTDDQ